MDTKIRRLLRCLSTPSITLLGRFVQGWRVDCWSVKMRKKIPAALIKRVEKLEQERGTKKHRPVAMFPRLMSVDEWGELAGQMQAILKENVKKDTAPDYGDLPKLELVVSR